MPKASVSESLLKALESKRLQAHRNAWGRYRSMLRTLHDGGAVDPDEASDILAAVNKSDEDLAKDIATFGQRVLWAKKVAAGAEAKVEYAAVEKEIAQYEKELADLRAKLAPKFEHAHNRHSEILALSLQAQSAHTRLIETVLDGILIEDDERLRNELEPLRSRLGQLKHAQFAGKGYEGDEQEIKSLSRTIAKLEAQFQELQQRKLEP